MKIKCTPVVGSDVNDEHANIKSKSFTEFKYFELLCNIPRAVEEWYGPKETVEQALTAVLTCIYGYLLCGYRHDF